MAFSEGFQRALDESKWFVTHCTADGSVHDFEADGWFFYTAGHSWGAFLVLGLNGHRPAELADAIWLSEVMSFDHDAPFLVKPVYEVDPDAGTGEYELYRRRERAESQDLPLAPILGSDMKIDRHMYWQTMGEVAGAISDLRFGGNFALRYENGTGSPSTDFSCRLGEKREALSLYAMATRQFDPLSEYLCLYRVLEAADGQNGKAFSRANLRLLQRINFGTLLVDEPGSPRPAVNAFEIYRERALRHVDALKRAAVIDIPAYLYDLRNRIAHGKYGTIRSIGDPAVSGVVAAIPIVKLLARIFVEAKLRFTDGQPDSNSS
ncbi:MAG: hypothetical protein R3F21_22050 [Myxococcota bacterium]